MDRALGRTDRSSVELRSDFLRQSWRNFAHLLPRGMQAAASRGLERPARIARKIRGCEAYVDFSAN